MWFLSHDVLLYWWYGEDTRPFDRKVLQFDALDFHHDILCALKPYVLSLHKGELEPSTGQTRYMYVTAHWKHLSNHKSGWPSTDITTSPGFLGFQVQLNFGQGLKHFGHVQFSTLGAIMCAAAQMDKRLRDRESIFKWVVYMYQSNRKGKGQEAARQWTSEIREALKITMSRLDTMLDTFRSIRCLVKGPRAKIPRHLITLSDDDMCTYVDCIWHRLVSIKVIHMRYFWRLYEKAQIRLHAPGGSGRKRDLEAFERDWGGV